MESVKKFVAVSYSYGNGYGYGTSYGYGDGMFGVSVIGDGIGKGYGKGCGSGYGYSHDDGYGCDYGYSYGIKSFNGKDVFLIDDIKTIITAAFGSTAKGFILENDLTLTPCYVAKSGNTFAHGNTLKEAIDALHDKLFDDMPEEDRIAEFFKTHSPGVKYPAKDLFVWHNRLTGSCEAGRMSFVRSHDIDLGNDTFTIEEFVSLCKDSYGGETIKKLLN